MYELRFLLHPSADVDYRHFQDAGAHPFRPAATGVPRVNAWWLSEAALVAYWPSTKVPAIAGAANLGCEPFGAGSANGYLLWNDAALIVTFRGTADVEDIATDLNFLPAPWIHGRVHRGFRSTIDAIWPSLCPRIAALAASRTVWFCGHSLGGALAVLAADRHGDSTAGICTIGSPRVGDADFERAFNSRMAGRTLRYVNDRDFVTHLPFAWLGFRHVGAERFIDRRGAISAPHASADDVGMTPAWPSGAREPTRVGVAPMFILDHMPKAYAIWTWNDYDANG